MLSDAEVICAFMEPKPEHPPIMWNELSDPRSHSGWWRGEQAGVQGNYRMEWAPGRTLTLDALREVQERLTEEQWWAYERDLRRTPFDGVVNTISRVCLHASAEQKVRAIAAILRQEVQK